MYFLSSKPFSWWAWGGSHPQTLPWGKRVTRSSAGPPAPGRRCGHSAPQPRPSGVSRGWLFWLENTEWNDQGWKMKIWFPRYRELAQVNLAIYGKTHIYEITKNWPEGASKRIKEKFRAIPKIFGGLSFSLSNPPSCTPHPPFHSPL